MKRRRIAFRAGTGLLALAAIPVPPAAPQSAAGGFRAGREAKAIDVTPAHRRAVDEGLRWLAEHQNPDGSWSAMIGYKLNEDYRVTGDAPHVGVTALACMAFLAGGHLPGRGEYGQAVERGLNYVLSASQKDGYITQEGTRMYSHAFATLFLAEVYGMTHRQDVRGKLQKAVDFIVDTQNAEGGWRYVPFDPTSDMSIVVCQVLALRAARNIGIRVPRSTVDRAARYVVESAITEESRPSRFHPFYESDPVGSFVYQARVKEGSRSSFPLTAAGVTSLYGLGIYSDAAIQRGLDYLRQNLESFTVTHGRLGGGHYFFWYGHYYAVQAMYTAGSSAQIDYWEPYFERVREEILSMQLADGSFPNHVGPGPAFGTAAAVLILEIPYRYLPIFQR
ncbi:MAG: prenyltransferase/squalene oxidase repeat-containing protein [Planctomycetota bacterium]